MYHGRIADSHDQVLTPLITSQITPADKVFINKKDVATPEEMESAHKIVREIDPEATVVDISATNMGLANILKVLEICNRYFFLNSDPYPLNHLLQWWISSLPLPCSVIYW